MTQDTLNKAVAEAQRFLAAAKLSQTNHKAGVGNYGCKEHGATKRASLDLTRALAAMRRPV